MVSMIGSFTRTDYDRLPEGFPAQLIGGTLLKEPSPTYEHQSLQMELLRMLMPLVPRGRLIAAPADVAIDATNVFQPDIVVLRAPPADRSSGYVGTPLLAIEILSAATAERDRSVKAPKYIAAGVAEVWLVDPTARVIERRTPGAIARATGTERLPSTMLLGFEIVPEVLWPGPDAASP